MPNAQTGIGSNTSAASHTTTKTETAIELVTAAKEAFERLKKGNKQLWADWVIFGEAFHYGSELMMKTHGPKAYSNRYGGWLKDNGLNGKIDPTTRADLLRCMREKDKIEVWLAHALDDSGRFRRNNPQVVDSAYRADLKARNAWLEGLKSSAEYPALKREEDSVQWAKFGEARRKAEEQARADKEKKAEEAAIRKAEQALRKANGEEVEEQPKSGPKAKPLTKAQLEASVAELSAERQKLVTQVEEMKGRDFDTADPDNEHVAAMMLDKLGTEKAVAIAEAVLQLAKSMSDTKAKEEAQRRQERKHGKESEPERGRGRIA